MVVRERILPWVSAVLLCAAIAPALETGSYRYVRAVNGAGDREELAAVTLDSGTWDSLQKGAADLRVFGSDGRAAPYLLRKAVRKELQTARIPCKSTMDSFKQLPGNQAEIRLSLATNTPAADGIIFDTPLKDFERGLSVWGLNADGSELLLVEDALIYDYSRFVDVRHCSVSLPANTFRQFKIRVNAVTDEAQSPQRQIERTLEGGAEIRMTDESVVTARPFRMDQVRFYGERQTESRRVERKAEYQPKSWTVRLDDRSQRTLVEVETFNEPVTAFVIETDARNFSRTATVEVPRREGGIETWHEVGQSSISRITFRSFLRQEMAVTFPERRSRRFRVVIHNHDGPSLAVTGVHAVGPVWQAVFMADPALQYTVCYGGVNERPPVYDTDHLDRVLAQEYEPVDFMLGAQRENPDFRRKGGGFGGLIGGRGFFIFVVVLMVAVLAVSLVRAGKKMGSGEEKEE